MPFFCAVPENFPIDPNGVREVPGAGPYYFAEFNRKVSILIKTNPYYRGTRPQRWDEVKIAQNVGVQTSYLQVRRGEIDLDISGLPPTAHTELTKEYGVNKGRYFVTPGPRDPVHRAQHRASSLQATSRCDRRSPTRSTERS